MIAYIFILIKFFFLESLNIPSFINNFNFALFVLSILLISAAGYVINDIHDVGIDKINKENKVIVDKHITKDKAYNIYFALNLTGLALGFYLSYLINHINFAFIYVASSLLLYQYASNLKKSILIGNLLISGLAALSVFTIALYDLLPAINDDNVEVIAQSFKVIGSYSGFAFIITFLREIIKDIEDIDGDRRFGVKSLAIVLGVDTTKKIASTLAVLPLLTIFYYSLNFLNQQTLSITYVMVFIEIPLLYFIIKVNMAKNKTDFSKLSSLLKIIMFTGITSILIFTLILKFNYVI